MTFNLNIKDDYGAVGDGQLLQTATISITSGTNDLLVVGNNFTGGDVNKLIAIRGAGDGGAGGLVSDVLVTTITAVGSFTGGAQHITLNDNATHTLVAATKRVEWGTDDNVAFRAFAPDNAGDSGTLTIPSGRYIIHGGGGGPGIFFGIPTLTVNCGTSGNGVVLSDLTGTGAGFFLGGSHGQREKGLNSDDPYSARLATAISGSTSVTLLDVTRTSLFTVGDWVKIGSWDAQDDVSFPSNNSFSEFKQIASKSGASSEVIHLTSALTFTHKSTWPNWYLGDDGHADGGGPATIFKLRDGWDCDHVYNDLNTDQFGALIDAVGRSITFNNIDCGHGFSIYPTRSKTWTANNLVTTNTGFVTEFDKFNDEAIFVGGTVRAPKGFSASTGTLRMTDVIITDQFTGTPRETYLSGCVITPAIGVGPSAYGTARSFYAENTSFNGGFDTGGVREGDVFGAGAYTLLNGVFTRDVGAGSGEPPQWCQPGSWAFLGGINRFAYCFQILDVVQSGSDLVITTNLPDDILDIVPPNASSQYEILTHPAVDFTLVNCDGSAQALAWSNVLPNKPMYERWHQTCTDFSGGTNINFITVAGNVSSIRLNVTQAYTGSGTLTASFDGPFVLVSGSRTVWDPKWDLKTTGQRTITLSTPGTPLGIDANLTVPDTTRTWIIPDQILLKLSKDISGDDPSTWPAFELEIILDQGINATVQPSIQVIPIRFRFH